MLSFLVNNQKNPIWKLFKTQVTYQEQKIFPFPYVILKSEVRRLGFEVPTISFSNIKTAACSCYWTSWEDKYMLWNENEASTSPQLFLESLIINCNV